MRLTVAIAVTAGMLAGLLHPAQAQTYPARSIKVVVPFAAGGGVDVSGRLIADAMGRRLGQQVIVENRPGGDTTIGVGAVATAAPDGYTILYSGNNMIVHAAYEMKLAYDGFRDLIPISEAVIAPMMFMSSKKLGASTLREVVGRAKRSPGAITYAQYGTGSFHYLAFKMLEQSAGITLLGVPYKGTGPATTALISGEVDLIATSIGAGAKMAEDGQAYALGVSILERDPAAPKVPMLAESGYPGFSIAAKFYFWAPAATPSAIVQRLNSEIVNVLRGKEIVEKLTALGYGVRPSSVEQARASLQTDYVAMRNLVKTANLKAEHY